MATSSRNRASDQKVTVSALAARLAKGTPPVSIVVGKEDLLRREAIDQLLESIPGGTPDADSVIRYQGNRRSVENYYIKILFCFGKKTFHPVCFN